ncbi:MAG: T9SS type A sorting domain-containing protein [Bacteroidetes bacterium]|nr:T9SS type A sorting domain-containing protein [Bacteroidota bacterium]
MIKQFTNLFLLLLIAPLTVLAQPTCTPNPLYADSAFGIWPDTVEDFPPGCRGAYYETVLNFKIPTDGGAIDPQYNGMPVDSAKVNNNGVSGLPPGLSYVCNQYRCAWNGGQQGCAVIYGTPTQAGVFDITVSMTGYSHIISTVIPVPLTFTNYRIVICELTAGITSTAGGCNIQLLTANGSGCTGPYNYSWSDGSTTQGVTVPASTYSVTVSESGNSGCNGTASYTVVSTPLPVIDSIPVTNTTLCTDNNGSASVSVSGGLPPYSYAWSNGQTGTSATGLAVGAYGITVTDDNGCTISGIAAVNSSVSPSVSTSVVNNVTCNGGNNGSASAIVTGGFPPYTFLWGTTPAQTTSIATGMAAGNYALSVTDSSGCNAISQVTVTEPAQIDLSGTTVQNEVSGNDGAVTVVASGGTPPFSYSWSTPNGSGSVATGLNGGAYSVTVTDDNGCSMSGSFNVIDGIYDFNYRNMITLYPNPSSGETTVSFNYLGSSEVIAEIYDFTGKEIYSEIFLTQRGDNNLNFKLSFLNPGLFLLNLTIEDEKYSMKMVVIKNE